MAEEQVKFTFRMAKSNADNIDAKIAQYGFGTRSKFLTEAGLAYGETAQFDDIMGELADINFALHRLSQTEPAGYTAVPQADLKALIREARKLMASARGQL